MYKAVLECSQFKSVGLVCMVLPKMLVSALLGLGLGGKGVCM